MEKKENKELGKDNKKGKKPENYEKPLKIEGTFEEVVKVLVKEEEKGKKP